MTSERTKVSVPLAVARGIALYTDRNGLAVLARTTRTCQVAAESRLYESLEVPHGRLAFTICHTLASCPRVAIYVRNFILHSQPQRTRDREHDQAVLIQMQRTVQRRDYWDIVRSALANMHNLDYLHMTDPTFTNSWVLCPTNNWTMRPTEVRINLPWDENVAAFLEPQDRLEVLCIAEVPENIPLVPLSPTALPNLNAYEGPIILIDQLINRPITNLKFPIDTEDAVSLLPLILPELNRFPRLSSLSIVGMPLEMAASCTLAISKASPDLKYLSYIPLPIDHKTRLAFLQHLSHLRELAILEVDVTHWVPQVTGNYQRIFAVEIRMVLPSIKYILFWNGRERWVWVWNPEDVEPIQQEHIAGGRGAGDSSEEEMPVGLEGWRHTWSHPHWMTHSTTWRNY